MPKNLNLEKGQTWRDKHFIVTITKIERDFVHYDERSVNTNKKDVLKEGVSVQDFQDWIIRRNAKFVKPEKAERKLKKA
jgi:hypothetical protein